MATNAAASNLFDGMSADDESTNTQAGGTFGTFDFSTVNENQMAELLPPGTYPAVIEDATYGHARTSGNEMITLTMMVTNADTGKRRKLWNYLVFTEGALPGVKRTLSRIAPELINGRQFTPAQDFADLIGRTCQVKVRTKPYEGQPRNEIQEVLPPASGADGMSIFQ